MSHDPPYSVLEDIGVAASERIEKEMPPLTMRDDTRRIYIF